MNVKIKRRSDVVGIFANEKSVLRLAGAVPLEIHDERAVAGTLLPHRQFPGQALRDRAG